MKPTIIKHGLLTVLTIGLVFILKPNLFSETAKQSGTANPKSMMKLGDTKKSNRKSNTSLTNWLNKLKTRVNRTKAKHNRIVAVASVRGAKAEEPTPLYWKGKTGKSAISPEELKKFEDAIDMATAGKTDDAKTNLEGFIAAYPKSALVADAKETIALLTPESAASSATTAQTESVPAQAPAAETKPSTPSDPTSSAP